MFVVCIAGIRIGIDNKYTLVEELFRPYCIEGKKYDFNICAAREDIDLFLRQWPGKYDGTEITPAEAENIVLRKNIRPHLLQYNAFFLHSCVVEMDGFAYAFSADSGVGKSTHASLWLRAFGEKVRIICGDISVVRHEKDIFYAYGTPWGGKEGWQINTSAPLRGICFLQRADANMIRKLNIAEAFLYLRYFLKAPNDEVEIRGFLELMDKLLKSTPVYLLQCNMQMEAALVAYNGMNCG